MHNPGSVTYIAFVILIGGLIDNCHPTSYYNNPIRCFVTATTIESLVDCWGQFVPPRKFISNGTWTYFAPTQLQKMVWDRLIEDMLSSDGNCTKIQMSSLLDGVYSIKAFYDKKTLYCALYEVSTLHKYFRRGWGLFMVPFYKKSVRTNLHISVAHPFSDGPVHRQAATWFAAAGAQSLLISGLRKDSRQATGKCGRKFLASDVARDDASMFQRAATATAIWQQTKAVGGCPNGKCAFLQLHGKQAKTCPVVDAFLSAGIGGRQVAGKRFYANAALPVNRLKKALLKNRVPWTVLTPDDSRCRLTGVTNVFGKVLNNVPPGRVCRQRSNAKTATGRFVHVVQSPKARGRQYSDVWIKSLLSVFGI